MVRGYLTSALIVVVLVLSGVQSECVNTDNDDMFSLLFKKLDKLQDKHQDEMTAMREKMQDKFDDVTEQMQGIRENMQERIDGMTEKSQKMQEDMVGMKEKFQGHEEINKLKIERIEERCDQIDNKENDKPSVDVNTVSNNETSLAMAVLQLSTSLENFQTCRGDKDTDIEAQLTEQNGLSELRTTVEDLQARVQDLAASEDSDNQASNQIVYINEIKPRYCHDIYIQGERRDGVFQIYPGWNRTSSVNVWCEFDVGSEVGWTVILARMPTEEPVNFSRGWDDYKAGFGDPHNEYWIGLSLLYEISHSHCLQVLHVSLHSWDHASRHAQYKDFNIGDEESGFQLSIGGYSGDAGDALSYNNGMKFSTKDKDNDNWGNSCADYKTEGGGGGFWYNSCSNAFLYSPLHGKGESSAESSRGVQWNSWLSLVNLKKIILKISPKLPSFI